MDLADLEYPLPSARIAQQPAEPRDAARLLVDRGPVGKPEDRIVADLPTLIGAGDLIVVNSSRVFPARLHAAKETGGAVEVLLVERHERDSGRASERDDHVQQWSAMIRPSRRVPVGSVVRAGALEITVGADEASGRTRTVTVRSDLGSVDERLAVEGSLALPPYITAELADVARYQTVYADRLGSVAAPTAGLHLTPELLDAVRAAGAQVASIDLAVGLGTFLPVTADHLDDHVMHHERFDVGPEVLDACGRADRVIAVGTTTVRALESAVRTGNRGSTDLFIRPGFDFRVVDALLTNFHQPRSTLLALLAAFVGPHWRDLYAHALASDYRFLSFGDAMFIPERAPDAA